MKTIILFFLIQGIVLAQKPPYDVFPDAEPPYYRVRYEAKQVGDLAFPVKFTIWIPEEVNTLHGIIVHQHGCGEGSCKSGLTGAWDLHWQALARKHDCALMAPSYEQPQKANCQLWCDPRNGSDDAFRQSLVDLGKLSGHPELATIPWALWGHSGGGHWAGGMVMLHPDRIIAAWLRSGVPYLQTNPDRPDIKAHQLPRQALEVPIMCNLGTKEGYSDKSGRFARVWPANLAFFETISAQQGRIAYSIDPLTSHECGNQRYLAIPWFDACLSARLTEKPGAPLKSIDPASEHNARVTHQERSLWLPGQKALTAWEHYMKDTNVPDTTPPPAPTDLRIDGNKLTWKATADLESGLAHFIIERDGKEIATVPEKPTNKFGRPLFQGLQYSDTPIQPLVKMEFTDPNPTTGKSTYRIIAVNSAGLRSK